MNANDNRVDQLKEVTNENDCCSRRQNQFAAVKTRLRQSLASYVAKGCKHGCCRRSCKRYRKFASKWRTVKRQSKPWTSRRFRSTMGLRFRRVIQDSFEIFQRYAQFLNPAFVNYNVPSRVNRFYILEKTWWQASLFYDNSCIFYHFQCMNISNIITPYFLLIWLTSAAIVSLSHAFKSQFQFQRQWKVFSRVTVIGKPVYSCSSDAGHVRPRSWMWFIVFYFRKPELLVG